MACATTPVSGHTQCSPLFSVDLNVTVPTQQLMESAMISSRNTQLFLYAAPLLLALAACSPHPATGTWATAAEPGRGFNRLDVTYEGRAHLFEVGEQEAGRRCFWGGESAQAIAMTCKPALDTAREERYHLALGADGIATLTRDGEVMARFSRQVR